MTRDSKRVFVAGATGVLGRRAVRDLVAAGHEVTGIARSEEKAALVRSLGATPVRVDLFDGDAVRTAVAGHDVVCNLATHVPPVAEAARQGAWREHERIRIEGSRILVDAAIAAGASVYIQESLAFAYADGGDTVIDEDWPLYEGSHAVAVRAAEESVARFTSAGGRGIALRFGWFYSDDSEHTIASVKAARRGLSMHLGAPDGYQPVIALDDAARAVVAALDAPAGAYNVVDDDTLTRRELDVALADAVNGRRLVRAPAAALKVAGESTKGFLVSNRASNRRFKDATGWSPRYPSAREGFRALARDLPGERTSLFETVALAYLGISALALGLYATFFPRGFYDDFPFGRRWVAVDGPYNEHLIRDFGGLNLALACFTLVAAFVGGRAMVRAAAASTILFGWPHVVYHLRHAHVYDASDKVSSIGGIGFSVLLAAAVLVSSMRSTRGSRTRPAGSPSAPLPATAPR
jgi:nucleoside-diphosphate-sugar epimerase